MKGQDIIGVAQTGTGKTAAFGIPIVEKQIRGKSKRPCAPVLVPTRELAIIEKGRLPTRTEVREARERELAENIESIIKDGKHKKFYPLVGALYGRAGYRLHKRHNNRRKKGKGAERQKKEEFLIKI